MNHLEHAQVYIDLPKAMQDDDALTFARGVVTLYGLLDKYKAEAERMRPVYEAAKAWHADKFPSSKPWEPESVDATLALAVDAAIATEKAAERG